MWLHQDVQFDVLKIRRQFQEHLTPTHPTDASASTLPPPQSVIRAPDYSNFIVWPTADLGQIKARKKLNETLR